MGRQMDVVLVVDTGTSSMRGILFGGDGGQQFSHAVQYAPNFSADGGATMDAAVFSAALAEIVAACAAHAAENGMGICGLSFTSQRSSVMAIDGAGAPLCPFLLWFDKRPSQICQRHNSQHGQEIYALSGMRLTTVSSAPKMQWLRETDGALYRRAYKLIGIHDYLLFLACGRLVTDASLASRTCLMDIERLSWSPRLLELFSLDEAKLCPLVPPGTVVGAVSADFAAATGLAAGTPVISAGGDQQCCVLGQGVYEGGTVSINSGTASYLCAVVDHPLRDPALELNINAACYGGRWIAEASNTGSGIVYQWFNREFFNAGVATSDCAAINAAVAAVPPGCDGLLCVTDFTGRGCPSTDPDARGVFANVGMEMTRGHFARAVLEGICFDIRESYLHMAGLGIAAERLQSSGGLTKFTEFSKILASALGQPILVPQQAEATALGACLSAWLALGAVDHPAQFFAALPCKAPATYLPDPALSARYDALFQQRLRLKSAVSPQLFKD